MSTEYSESHPRRSKRLSTGSANNNNNNNNNVSLGTNIHDENSASFVHRRGGAGKEKDQGNQELAQGHQTRRKALGDISNRNQSQSQLVHAAVIQKVC